jgi:hypothetical protein
VYGRRRDLLRDYPPDDLSGLLGANFTPEPEEHDKGGATLTSTAFRIGKDDARGSLVSLAKLSASVLE